MEIIIDKTKAAHELHCEGCGKSASSLTTWTVVDDDGAETIIWLCNGCSSEYITFPDLDVITSHPGPALLMERSIES